MCLLNAMEPCNYLGLKRHGSISVKADFVLSKSYICTGASTNVNEANVWKAIKRSYGVPVLMCWELWFLESSTDVC